MGKFFAKNLDSDLVEIFYQIAVEITATMGNQSDLLKEESTMTRIVSWIIVLVVLSLTPCFGVEVIGSDGGLRTEKSPSHEGIGWFLGGSHKLENSFFSGGHYAQTFTSQAVQISADSGETFAQAGWHDGNRLKIDAVLADKVILGSYFEWGTGTRSAYARSNRIEIRIGQKVFVGHEIGKVKVGMKIIEIQLLKISGPTVILTVRGVK